MSDIIKGIKYGDKVGFSPSMNLQYFGSSDGTTPVQENVGLQYSVQSDGSLKLYDPVSMKWYKKPEPLKNIDKCKIGNEPEDVSLVGFNISSADMNKLDDSSIWTKYALGNGVNAANNMISFPDLVVKYSDTNLLIDITYNNTTFTTYLFNIVSSLTVFDCFSCKIGYLIRIIRLNSNTNVYCAHYIWCLTLNGASYIFHNYSENGGTSSSNSYYDYKCIYVHKKTNFCWAQSLFQNVGNPWYNHIYQSGGLSDIKYYTSLVAVQTNTIPCKKYPSTLASDNTVMPLYIMKSNLVSSPRYSAMNTDQMNDRILIRLINNSYYIYYMDNTTNKTYAKFNKSYSKLEDVYIDACILNNNISNSYELA